MQNVSRLFVAVIGLCLFGSPTAHAQYAGTAPYSEPNSGAFVPQPPEPSNWPPQTAHSMAALKAKTAKLGAPRIEGTGAVGGKDVPALYFGTTKMNNNFDLVDEVVKENGGTATLFVKAGDEYVRVATNVKKDDGSRAIGTILDPNGPAIAMIRKGDAYYGDATILGKPYVTGYDPIRDASGGVIGIYYVGYLKG
jgi:cache 3/cache 2 fusion protein